jgi:hypothetical protein
MTNLFRDARRFGAANKGRTRRGMRRQAYEVWETSMRLA